MSSEQLLSHFRECRHRLSELRAFPDYLPLHCALLRLEGEGGAALYDTPFSRVLRDRPFCERVSVGHTDGAFALAFYLDAGEATPARLEAALAAVEALTNPAQRLLSQLPRSTRERLVLPRSDNWWRTVFHLAWHYPRPYLKAPRVRLLTEDGKGYGCSEETFVQLFGTGGRRDLLPGLIYSSLEQDLRISSEAAIDVVTEALRSWPEGTTPPALVPGPLTAEQSEVFRQLRMEFLAGAGPPFGVESKLLKLVDSFQTPPATEWASFQTGGCVERFLWLSRLDDMQEICQVRGPATDWFCEVAARAGKALPEAIPDRAILFEHIIRSPTSGRFRAGGPRPVMNRGPVERWVGFVYATLQEHDHPGLAVTWPGGQWSLSHGFATVEPNLFAASALAIDLAGLAGDAPLALDGDGTEGTGAGQTSPSARFHGWKILRDLPPDQVEQLPAPAAGRFVIALEPPALDGRAEMLGETRYVPRREYRALAWTNGHGENVLHQLDASCALLVDGRQDATWLPDGWEMNVFPAGWDLAHLERWFDYALEMAGLEDRRDIPPGSDRSPAYAPTPRGLVAHAHLIVRHLRLPNSPAEPRGVMDRQGCIAELRDLLDFFRRALGPTGGGTQPPAGKPAPSLVELLDLATREYAASNGSFWLAAIPSGVQLHRCEESDIACGVVFDGRVALPWGSLHTLGSANVGNLGSHQILAFALAHHRTDDVERFLSFAADAGATLIASPPSWAPPRRPGSPASNWAFALLFHSPHTAGCVVEKPGGCRLIFRPWAAALAALRGWEGKDAPRPKHSSDFRTVDWFGTSYFFTATQAACVKVLWREWEHGTPAIGEDTILEDPEVEAEAKRLIDLFRDRKSPKGHHPAWGNMIAPGPVKGTFRLKLPEKP
jgi:hypothetical protein